MHKFKYEIVFSFVQSNETIFVQVIPLLPRLEQKTAPAGPRLGGRRKQHSQVSLEWRRNLSSQTLIKTVNTRTRVLIL